MKNAIAKFKQNFEKNFGGNSENNSEKKSTDSEKFSRGYAWYDLNKAFADTKLSVDEKAKELFIYLANWGMVARGSFLMKHTWRILTPVVKVLQKPEYKDLRNPEIEIVEKNIDLIIKLRNEIDKELKKFHDNKPVSYTLISKIMLGTLACTVAYDRNVKEALSESEIAFPYFNEKSITALCDKYKENKDDLEKLRNEVEARTGEKCPPFKLLDLILWSSVNTENDEEEEE